MVDRAWMVSATIHVAVRQDIRVIIVKGVGCHLLNYKGFKQGPVWETNENRHSSSLFFATYYRIIMTSVKNREVVNA